MSEALLPYVEPVYRFCLKRLSSRADAEDLSQEILLCVLQGMKREIANMDGYVWRVAHNRYARRIQARKGEPIVFYGHDSLPDFPCAAQDDEADESQNIVFKALHTLSAMYRDILVDYYVRNMDTRQIAACHGASVETIKWRLHVGREKIRERMVQVEKNYDRVKMKVGCNGWFDPEKYLQTQLHKAIAKACYASPLNMEEISLATGVPTLYLEEILDFMVYGDAIEPIGKKFATNFIISPAGMSDFLEEPVVKQATDAILGYIQENENKMRGIGFYGSAFPLAHLLHIIVPAIIYKCGDVMDLPYPPRKDGGHGWFFVVEGTEQLSGSNAGMNGYTCGAVPEGRRLGPRFRHFWTGDTLNRELDKLLRRSHFFLSALCCDHSLDFADEENHALALAHGLCENKDGKTMPSIPVFSEEEYDAFTKWAEGCTALQPVWDKWIKRLTDKYKSIVPKRLADQIPGNVACLSADLSAHVLKELKARGLAAKSDENIFTKNLLMIR